MPLDNFDKKIRQVTEDNLPPFNESDWGKMQILLDKNLPVKKERRIFLFLLFSFLLFGLLFGGIYISNKLPNNNKVNSTSFKKLNFADSVDGKNGITKETNSINRLNTTSANNISIERNDASQNDVSAIKEIAEKTSSHSKEKDRSQIEITTNNNSKMPSPKLINTAQLSKENTFKVIKNNNTINKVKRSKYSKDKLTGDASASIEFNKSGPTSVNILSPENKFIKEKNTPGDTIIQSIPEDKKREAVSAIAKPNLTAVGSIDRNTAAANQKAKKKKNAKKNEIAFTLTTGVESSGIKLSSQSKLTPEYGFGFQFSVGKKITLRTGLNVVKKIYTAKDGDYKAPMGSWAFNVTFKNILADCKVLELPLSIAYKIKAYKKSNFYTTIGSSSYFMKREDYQFFYKAQNGNDTTRAAHFANNSNHLFSSVNVSVIAEQKITNNFSILVEPFVKLPIGGIGFGKVKLYNTGLLLTAKIKIK
jgi:hypothetical protein